MKRVYCLYRVSSKAQVEKDDIPMQKQACREFAERQGWTVEKEFYEKGVSGFKKSAKDRDEIQKLQRAAIAKEFEVLLVFMLDRLGRRDEETPFLVEWFVNKGGVEVWSVKDGQRRFDNHADKLMNYITFWHASGESIKNSMRVKERKAQLAEEGLYYGGKAPYGYQLMKKGRTNKKGYEIRDIEKNPLEAEHVKIIYEKYVYEGLGYLRIRKYLAENGIRNRNGDNFSFKTIQSILQNPICTGVMVCGDKRSQVIPELRIIDEDMFQHAQSLRHERANEQKSTRTIPLNTKGTSLLAGNVFCAHCGGRLHVSDSGQSYVKKDGTRVKCTNMRYVCHNKTHRIKDCDGQTVYGMKKLDGMITELVVSLLQNLKGTAESELIAKSYQGKLSSCRTLLKSAKEELEKEYNNLKTLQNEVIKAIQGISKFDTGLLNNLIQQTSEKVESAKEKVEGYEMELQNGQYHLTSMQTNYKQLINWSEIFQDSNAEAKKMITAYLIKSVKVGRGYELEVSFNVAFEQFFNAM